MKLLVVSLAALSFAAPAFAEDRAEQQWPKQDWRLLQITPVAEQTPASAKRDGGAYAPDLWLPGADVRLGGPAPGGRQNVAVNLSSINRVGDKVELQYFVWPDDRSDYTEITAQIDCSKTGELVVLARLYDRRFAYVRTSDHAVKRTDARARAIATYACGARRGHGVDGKSLPELAQGG